MSDYIDEINGVIVEDENIDGELIDLVEVVRDYEFSNGLTESKYSVTANLSNETPNANGQASAGTSTDISRADHIHPTDTTRASASDLNNHVSNTNNPHSVTKQQVGLGNVDNTSDLDKPVSIAVQTELNKKVNSINGKTGAVVLDAADVGALSSSTKYGASLSVNGQSVQLKDQDGNNLGLAITTQDTDTGATSVGLNTGDNGNVITNMTYDETTRKITFEKGITALTEHQDISGKLDKKPDGTTDLIDNSNKINATYLPDYILGQLLYGGTVTTGALASLTPNAKAKLGTISDSIILTNDTTAITGYEANDGIYYIAQTNFVFAGLTILTGDWLLSKGNAWTTIANTDAVTGVKGNAENSYRIGNVEIYPDDLDDTNTTNKFVTASDKTNWNAKQDAIAHYLKNASVSDNTLTITKEDDSDITFQGGSDIDGVTITKTMMMS